jgi:hypothetical protein
MTSPVARATGAGAGRVLRFVLAAIPWVAVLGVTPFMNRVEPFIFGMPFLLAWVVLCVVGTSVCMAIVYASDPRNRAETASAADAGREETGR